MATTRKTTTKPLKDESIEIENNLLMALVANGFNVTKACLDAGISRQAYYYKMQNEEFANKVKQLSSSLPSYILEGLTHPDLNIRHKFLSLIPQSTINRLLGFETANTFESFKGTITFN